MNIREVAMKDDMSNIRKNNVAKSINLYVTYFSFLVRCTIARARQSRFHQALGPARCIST